MIFALITLLSALSLATVAGWFSIVGFMAIYAGAPIPALIMGVVTEAAKLVTASWLYRNWKYADWKLKGPLIYFTIALMVATSIGVFGFLSKAHLEQGSGTIDNSAKIEQLNYQINREKALIADNEKVIGQLDATVNSFLGKDRTDRSLSVRRSQAPQRKQLKDESDVAQKKIDELSSEKFKLESEVRKMELEVGPIRYIAELFYGVEENATKNIEAAVRIFTLLIVSTLDPLAVILLIAANHTLLRLKNEKEEEIADEGPASASGSKQIPSEEGPPIETAHFHGEVFRENPPNDEIIGGRSEEIDEKNEEAEIHIPVSTEIMEPIDAEEKNDKIIDTESIEGVSAPSETATNSEEVPEVYTEQPWNNYTRAEAGAEKSVSKIVPPNIKSPNRTRVMFDESSKDSIPTKNDISITPPSISNRQDSIFRELRGSESHFTPQKVIENKVASVEIKKLFPNALSWLSEFKRK